MERISDLYNNTLKEVEFASVFTNWHTNLKLVFLTVLDDELGKTEAERKFKIENYKFIKSTLDISNKPFNKEVQNLWFKISLKQKDTDVFTPLKTFLGSTGRMKYIVGLYKDFALVDWNEAKKTFDNNR